MSVPPRIWKKCQCIESKEGRCKPHGSVVVKKGSGCFMFKSVKDAEEYLGLDPSPETPVESKENGLPDVRDRDSRIIEFRKLAKNSDYSKDDIGSFIDGVYDYNITPKENYKNFIEMNKH